MRVETIARMTLGVKDHRVVSVTGDTQLMVITMDRKRGRRLPCSGCGTRRRIYDRLDERTWRHVPLWNIPAIIAYRPCRVSCPDCGITVEQIPWGPSKSPLSLPLVDVLARMTRLLAIDVVAKMFGFAWNTVAAAVSQAVDYGLANRDTEKVYYLGIDEISRKKGHVYHTQVYDLEEKRLLWSAEGRSEKTIRAFFDSWGAERTARIKAVCCDMWAPYIDVIKERAPTAVLVNDKFHVVAKLLDAVDSVRRQEAHRLAHDGSDVLKQSRYIWLKNPWNLTDRQKKRLSFLEHLNLKITRAYLMKEIFMALWTIKVRTEAERFLKLWFWWATHSRLKPLRDFAWMVRRHEEGILAWFDVPINNGSVEGMNNNAKKISHQARGYRSEKWFTTVMLHNLGKLPLPQLTHRFL